MQGQTGTTSLRALLYFDEIFGFFPAVAEPPSKRPLLTLLKQARAFGLGCILAAQNPIDIDYKGLTNAGIWFIGRLQAQRDKERVLSGLKGAIAEARGRGERVDFAALIGQLRSRLFLVHNVHNEQPMVMQTRWAMSYLRGPLTKPQVAQLVAGRKAVAAATQLASQSAPLQPVAPTATPGSSPVAPPGYADTPPSLDPLVTQIYLPVSVSEGFAIQQLTRDLGRALDVERIALVYEPAILGGANVRFVDRKRNINELLEKVLLTPAPVDLGGIDWQRAESPPLRLSELVDSRPPARSEQGPFFAPAPESANSARELKSMARSLADWLYYHSRLALTHHPELGILHRPGERERSFKIRLQQAARERRDTEVDALADKYEARIDRLEARLRKEERDLIADEADYDARKREERITLGETIFSFFRGRRRTRTISTVASKRRLAEQARLDVEETRDEIEGLEDEIEELEGELESAARDITRKWADLLNDLAIEEIHPRRTDVDVRLLALAWLPSWLITYNDGIRSRTATIAAHLSPGTGAPDPF
jgi:hypothetical protein